MALLLIDMDEVAADLMTPWLAAINAETGENLRREDITDWDISRFTVMGSDCYKFIRQPGFCRHLRPLPGAQRVLGRLFEAGHEIFFVTSAVDEAYGDKRAWVDEFFGWIGRNRVIACQLKHVFALAGPNGILVDDRPLTIEHYRAELQQRYEQPPGAAVVFDQPWNRRLPGPRVDSWQQLERWVAQHCHGR